MLIRLQFGQQQSDAVLELAVLGGVDERVDAAVGQHQCHRKAEVPNCVVDIEAAGEDESEDYPVRGETRDETTAYNQ